MSLELVDVDEPTLGLLRQAAVTDAAADEVTPPLTPGPAWTPERIAWFEEYHRSCRDGLATAAGQQTWAVVADGEVVGSVRLARVGEDVETGIWLCRAARGRGLAGPAVDRLVPLARAAGARRLLADTAATNLPARASLQRLGFELAPRPDGRVGAVLDLA